MTLLIWCKFNNCLWRSNRLNCLSHGKGIYGFLQNNLFHNRNQCFPSIKSFQILNHSAMTSSFPNLEDSKLIAVAQMTSRANKKKNWNICVKLVEEAVEKGAKMVFLPEGCDYIAESKKSSMEMAEPLNGATVNQFCELAKVNKIWLSLGGIHIMEEGQKKIRNTHIIINGVGQIVASYVKAHLFDVSIPEQNIHLQESSYVEAGSHIVNPVPTICGLVGMGICYDLRFPEFSLHQRILGAEILTFPSAFTVHTGLAHWHTLLRARAIENQCYVIAAAQTGHHNNSRASFGHALVINPWGSTLCEINEGTGVALAEINLKYLEKVRTEMPVIAHRKPNLYTPDCVTMDDPCRSGLTEILTFPKAYIFYKFGQVNVPGSCIFLKTHLSQAFTNKKPFVSGHVLVTPEKPSYRFTDLSEPELFDLAQTVVLTLKVLNIKYSSTNGTQIAIQDGPNAGQTINHIHVHLVPQHKGDDTLTATYETDKSREWRDVADMEKESLILRDIVTELKINDKWLNTLNFPSSIDVQDSDTHKLLPYGDASNFVFFSGKTYIYLASEPILQGHVELRPQKNVKTLTDLSPAEVIDLFLCIQIIQKCLETFYGTFSTTIFIADNAPETKGLIAHVVPRKENDLEVNDNIYALFMSQEDNKFCVSKKNCNEELLEFLKKNVRPMS